MAEEGAAFRLDRGGVRAAFDRAGVSYESASQLQARVAQELLTRLETFRFEPAVVLDLGAGTGRVTLAGLPIPWAPGRRRRRGRALLG